MAEAKRKIKGRSPRYPGISLDTAVERVDTLYKRESRYPTNVQTALGHWGYAPKSGAGAVAVAALKAYGLVEDSGTGDARTIQVTDLAEDILVREGNARLAAIQSAALSPPAHADLWDRYGPSFPSDTSLALYLTRERGFTPGGAQDLISVYKRTLTYARLTERGATVSPDVSPQRETPTVTPAAPAAPAPGKAPAHRTRGYSLPQEAMPPEQIGIPVPLPEGMALLSFPMQMSEASWKQVLTVLEAYKPTLMAKPDESDSKT